MRYQGIHTSIVAKTIGKSVASVTIYINRWNKSGMDAVADLRGGSISTFTDEMLDDLKDTVMNKNPREFGFTAATWNTHMLKQYIADKYGREYSSEWIRQLLIKSGFSYKRGLYQPTKADPELQELFKKMANLLDIIENTEDVYLFVIYETGLRLESKNHCSWSPKGKPVIIEQNGSRKGLNIIMNYILSFSPHILLS